MTVGSSPRRSTLTKQVASVPGIGTPDTSGRTDVNNAYQLFLAERYGEALGLFDHVVQTYTDHFAAQRALVFVERCLEKLDRGDEVLPRLNSAASVYAGKLLAEFAEARRTYQYLRQGRYSEAAQQAQAIIAWNADTTLVKFALFDAGTIYWYFMGDTKTGERYFRELIARFPMDHLTMSALATLGEWRPSGSSPKKEISTETSDTPQGYALLQNYPNPFNPNTTIQYQLSKPSLVKLVVYDVLGRETARLVDEYEPAGSYSVKFDGSNLASGIYFFKFTAGGFVQANKMLFAK